MECANVPGAGVLSSTTEMVLYRNALTVTVKSDGREYEMIPYCSPQQSIAAVAALSSKFIAKYRESFGTLRIWREFCSAFGTKEARLGHGDQEAFSEDKVGRLAERDILRLTGGDSVFWERSFESGNFFTGYMMQAQGRIYGRVACAVGYSEKENLPEKSYDKAISVYKAEPLTDDEKEDGLRAAAESMIEDGIRTDISEEEFEGAYKAAILAALVLAAHFLQSSELENEGVPFRRLIVTVIDPEQCKPGSLDEKALRIIAIKRKILVAYGFTLAGYLLPCSIDRRNSSEFIQAVYTTNKSGANQALDRLTKWRVLYTIGK